MAVMREQLMTIREFQDFVEQPENSDDLFEMIYGEITKVSPGRTRNSSFPFTLAFKVQSFCQSRDLPCYISGADGAYALHGHVVAPDFAYKRTPMRDEYPDPEAPLWVVEIISPTDKAPDIRRKRQIYLNAGLLYWEMYPQAESIDVYTPGQLMRTVDVEGTLDGGEVLPGFTLAMRELLQTP